MKNISLVNLYLSSKDDNDEDDNGDVWHGDVISEPAADGAWS